MTDADLADAWDAVHDATPDGWYVGRHGYEEWYNRWRRHAFDTHGSPVIGKRSRDRGRADRAALRAGDGAVPTYVSGDTLVK